MQRLEDFMVEFFRARIAEEQSHQASRAPFRRKFFADDCRYDSHADTLVRMESEKVIAVERRESDPKVITEQTFHYSRGIRKIRLRYHLQPFNDGWLIRDVQSGCFVCEGRGESNCPYCKGKKWLGTEQVPGQP
jgi:hypothetical protein